MSLSVVCLGICNFRTASSKHVSNGGNVGVTAGLQVKEIQSFCDGKVQPSLFHCSAKGLSSEHSWSRTVQQSHLAVMA